MNNPSQEARRTSRHVPPTPTPVVDAMSGNVLGFVMDVSAGGMKLMAGEPLVDHGLYQVQFDLGLGDSRAAIEAGIQVISQRVGTDRSAVVGLRFIHLQAAQARKLGSWLQQMQVRAA